MENEEAVKRIRAYIECKKCKTKGTLKNAVCTNVFIAN